ncbi:hypothetical protein DE146DRAFT_213649 [Phaeosphaeria sp. MPI-PUGE-AT-0046c]|nr:hypothetical protein DE146DRAFT_213649 [Phaeosphaeria sp. MPI-PUGE-AT-0046c]
MSHSPSRIKPLSPLPERKREREVLQYVAAYRDLPHLDRLTSDPQSSHLPADHHARQSTDQTLTALCQLTALRMNAQRALVSLIDDTSQHILAEATPATSLCAGAQSGDSANSLWLGSVSVPRKWGICEQVLEANAKHLAAGTETSRTGTAVVVNEDLLNSSQHAQRTYVRDGLRVRFYAGAPLVGGQGAIIGTLCVFDTEPRKTGISDEQVACLESLATTVTEYLGSYKTKDRFARGEKLTRGLISFAEGASALLPIDTTDRFGEEPLVSSIASTDSLPSDAELRSTHEAPSDRPAQSQVPESAYAASQVSQAGSGGSEQTQKKQQFSAGSATLRPGSTRNTSLRALQDTILPMNSRSMFARAASVMLASSELDGVVILDASIAATGHRQHPAAPERERLAGTLSDDARSGSRSESSESSSSQGGDAKKNASSSSSKRCGVLGAAPSRPIINTDGTPGTLSLAENSLARLLREFPHGKVFNFTANGVSMSSTDESSSARASHGETLPGGEDARHAGKNPHSRASRSSKAISELLPGARSVAFVPFWDYERSRWFAGCLCWTNTPDRLLSASVDLAYFNIFSHSIMRELSRLDAVALNQQKTTFVASISHELRSPLHGILGTLEFIRDTPLDTFQTSMLNCLNSCGQTLLDTINHVMDHSKMSETPKSVSTRRLKNTKTVRLSSKPLKTRKTSRDPAFDLCIATEEVVESVFAGASFLPIMSSYNAPVSPTESTTTASSSARFPDITTKRKTCYIILDVSHENDWIYCFPVGPWKRTVMNLFGNAIKYTQTGHITVSLQATDVARTTGSATTITLTITDTGNGMSPAFLANKAFQPFSQENSHSSGVGLGLSIVRQIIETNGGKIEASSDHATGTKITVKLSLIRPEATQIALPQRNEYLALLPRLKSHKVSILHRAEANQDFVDEPQNAEGFTKFSQALTKTLTNHLKMDVIQISKWTDNTCDIVICPEPSFDFLDSIRDRRARDGDAKACVIVFVALDALEAATLRSDVRVQSKESIVEILTQPLGPHKLAYVLNKCLDRFKSSDENEQRDPGTDHQPTSDSPQSTSSPKPPLLSPVVEMPPLLNQPFWHQSDKPNASVPEMLGSPDASAPSTSPLAVAEHTLPLRPKLTKPSKSVNKTSKILITDDNIINRRLLVAFMKKYNLPYAEAENGLEALRTYQSAQDSFDIILMDMSMPVMDGMSATRAIRQYEQEYNIPRCCIVALTGLASASAKLEAWNAGIDQFMTKPVNFKGLEKYIKGEKMRQNKQREEGEGADENKKVMVEER